MALQKTEFVGERGLCLAGTHRPSFSTCSIVHDGSCGFHPHIQATQHAWTCFISSATGDLFLLEEVWMQPSNCICSCLTAVKYCSNACLLKESIQPVKASQGISTCRFCFWVIRRTSQQPICPKLQLFNVPHSTKIRHTIWQILVASFFFHLRSLGLVHFGAEI